MESSSQKVTGGGANSDFAQAFKDLARGEQTASAMETKLSSLEQRIDDLLASMDDSMDDKSRDEKNGEVENKQGHKD